MDLQANEDVRGGCCHLMKRSSYLRLIRGEKKGPLALLLRGLLRLLTIPYAFLSWSRNRLFDLGWRRTRQVDVPVISVGNITTGGTGKTPMVAWLARWLRDHGMRVALVSRGYGSRAGEANDEALELEQMLPDVPHLQNPDRVAAVQTAIAEWESQVIVLDDAFQHRRIHRDLDIVLVDATEPFGTGSQLPRGLLRESARELRRAGLVGITRSDQVADDSLQATIDRLQRLAPGIPVLQLRHVPRELLAADGTTAPLQSLERKQVLAVSGIGNPRAFHDSLQQAGMQLAASREFPDHHRFSRQEIDELDDWVKSHPGAEALICTGKDLARLQLNQLGGLPLWAMTIDMEVSQGLPALETYLESIVLMVDPVRE